MRAMILAAGKGERMRPLTDHTPKPLLKIANVPLIVYHLKNFAKAGITEIVINVNHLAPQIMNSLGDGKQWGVTIEYSKEDPLLETGGGIAKALPLLGTNPFIVVSGDIFTDFPFECLPQHPKKLAHLVLADNPPHHPRGDFALLGEAVSTNGPLLNFAGIGVYRPEFFSNCPTGAFPLSLLFKNALNNQQMTGEYHPGIWHNIGTASQLEMINNMFSLSSSS